jgi:hypothetical protein
MKRDIKVDLNQTATNTFAGRFGPYFGYNRKEFIEEARIDGFPSVVYSKKLKEDFGINMAFYVGKINNFFLQSLINIKKLKKTELFISYENAFALCDALGASDFGYVFDFDGVSWVAYYSDEYNGVGGIVCKDGRSFFIVEPVKNFLQTKFPKEQEDESDAVYVD